MHVAGRSGAGALDVKQVASFAPQNSFGQMAAAGVASAENQDRWFHVAGFSEIREGQQSRSRQLRQAKMASAAPATGAAMYTHGWFKVPDTIAGASERAGFI